MLTSAFTDPRAQSHTPNQSYGQLQRGFGAAVDLTPESVFRQPQPPSSVEPIKRRPSMASPTMGQRKRPRLSWPGEDNAPVMPAQMPEMQPPTETAFEEQTSNQNQGGMLQSQGLYGMDPSALPRETQFEQETTNHDQDQTGMLPFQDVFDMDLAALPVETQLGGPARTQDEADTLSFQGLFDPDPTALPELPSQQTGTNVTAHDTPAQTQPFQQVNYVSPADVFTNAGDHALPGQTIAGLETASSDPALPGMEEAAEPAATNESAYTLPSDPATEIEWGWDDQEVDFSMEGF